MKKLTVMFFLLLMLSGCSSGNVKSQAKAAPTNNTETVKKPKLQINQSASIFSYAAELRNRCMYLYNSASSELIKLHNGSAESLRKAISNNDGNILQQLSTATQRLEKADEYEFTRPVFALKSSETFIDEMEGRVATCGQAMLYLIDNIMANPDFIPDEDSVLPDDEIATRYSAGISPLLETIGQIYAFEANEYADYDNFLSSQYYFVLLMKHVYQTLQKTAGGYYGNENLPNKSYFNTELHNFSVLKNLAKKEAGSVEGMKLLFKIQSGAAFRELNERKEKNDKKQGVTDLNKGFDEFISVFEEEYSLLLMELAKEQPEQSIVLDSLRKLLIAVIGNEVKRSEYRQQYMQELLWVIKTAARQKQ